MNGACRRRRRQTQGAAIPRVDGLLRLFLFLLLLFLDHLFLSLGIPLVLFLIFNLPLLVCLLFTGFVRRLINGFCVFVLVSTKGVARSLSG